MVGRLCSEDVKRYISELEEEVERCYGIATRARTKGFDPALEVEVLKAEDLASRVERLLVGYGVEGVAQRIRAVAKDHDREETALLIAREIAGQPARSREEALERAIRVGLAILTEGVVVAPLEGLASAKVRRNRDGTTYLDVYYAGPIRSAGGTAQALSVLIADVVRREQGIGRYKATREEVERLKEEIPFYKQLQHLQYTPTDEEIDLVASNVPVSVNGEATEDEEIGGYRDLPRIETNRVRGGACLVVAEGLCLKAPKVLKHVRRLQIDGWEFLEEYVRTKKPLREDREGPASPDEKFIQNIIAGRPVLAHPSRPGGFRLRIGRARNTGLAAVGLPPATMHCVDDFIAVGTQLKIERPGKAGAVTPVDSLEGPLVLLKNGDLVELGSAQEALALREQVAVIVDLGEILIAYGEFLENNHSLLPSSYSLEWWAEEVMRRTRELPPSFADPGPEGALSLSRTHGLPLHPRYNLFWHDLSPSQLIDLRASVLGSGRWEEGALRLPGDPSLKALLEILGVPHRISAGEIVVGRHSLALLTCLGLDLEGSRIVARQEPAPSGDVMAMVEHLAGFPVRPRAPTRIGARMGRPEKAKERRMQPPPHALFPLGQLGGPQRLLSKALEAKDIAVEVGLRVCTACGKRWFLPQCTCGGFTRPIGRVGSMTVPLEEVHARALKRVGNGLAEVKGVQGMISRAKTPEALEKGLLRARHGVYVFKDGTVRFDMTNVPLTHFRPSEVGLSVDRARALGYSHDHLGRPLESEDQLVELRFQDCVLARVGGNYLTQVSKFVDDLLVKLYGLEPYYRAEAPEDLIGHLVIGLAPHTSVGVVARIIGYTAAKVGYFHPFSIAARRRDADGDEDSVMLLLDGLINFSRDFLPEKRGGLMDAPLVLTVVINPLEIDKEAHSMDVGSTLPLEVFEAAQRRAHPKEVEGLVDTVGKRIGTVLQYEGLGFTHATTDVAAGPVSSAYVEGSMVEKMEGQLSLAMRIRAVDAVDVVSRLVVDHFLPDIIGNLKAFSSQQVRCTKCNTKFRRIPLKGRCSECGGPLSLTVSEGSVRKYLELSKRIGDQFAISQYLRQRIRLAEEAIESLFVNERVQHMKLEDFL
jgi:DNA polymerase II large subunit